MASAELIPSPPHTTHSRRTDFKAFKGNDFTPLASYAASVENVRAALTAKLATQSRWNKARDRPYLRQFAVPPSEYKVLVATDEGDQDFRREVEALGWVVINHVSLLKIREQVRRLVLTSLDRSGAAEGEQDGRPAGAVVAEHARFGDARPSAGVRGDRVVNVQHAGRAEGPVVSLESGECRSLSSLLTVACWRRAFFFAAGVAEWSRRLIRTSRDEQVAGA